jgi:hypothetical protein
MKAKFEIKRTHGYGQYKIVRTTPKGKVTTSHCTDSQAYDDASEGKCSQARLERIFKF